MAKHYMFQHVYANKRQRCKLTCSVCFHSLDVKWGVTLDVSWCLSATLKWSKRSAETYPGAFKQSLCSQVSMSQECQGSVEGRWRSGVMLYTETPSPLHSKWIYSQAPYTVCPLDSELTDNLPAGLQRHVIVMYHPWLGERKKTCYSAQTVYRH